MFVAVEGPNGSGKSTIVDLVAGLLSARGWRVYSTREPTDSSLGRFIRASEDDYAGSTLSLLVAADRLEHVQHVITPRLTDHDLVITDRYLPSSLVLQHLDGVPVAEILDVNRHVPPADLTVYLTCAPDVARRRLAARSDVTRFELGDREREHARYERTERFLASRGWSALRQTTDQGSAHEVARQVADDIEQRLSG